MSFNRPYNFALRRRHLCEKWRHGNCEYEGFCDHGGFQFLHSGLTEERIRYLQNDDFSEPDFTTVHCPYFRKRAANFTLGTKKKAKRTPKTTTNNQHDRTTDCIFSTPGYISDHIWNKTPGAHIYFVCNAQLLIEDIWVANWLAPLALALPKGQAVSIFYGDDGLPTRFLQRLQNAMTNTNQDFLLSPLLLDGDNFKPLDGWVHSTPEAPSVGDSVNQAFLFHKLDDRKQSGIRFSLPLYTSRGIIIHD